MNRWDIKKIFTALVLAGFLSGIIYGNLFAKESILSMEIFSKYFLENYSRSRLHTEDYLLYICKVRITPVIFLILAGCTRYRKIVASLFVVWTGFSFGLIITAAVLKLKLIGIIFCLASILPHFICYIGGYLMLLLYNMLYPESRWNGTKTFSFIIFLLLGIISECYINPGLMDLVLAKIL